MENCTNETPTNTAAATEATPVQDSASWTYERRMAFFMLGKLALIGALNDMVITDFDYVLDSTADSITEALGEFGTDGDLRTVLNDADFGRIHQSQEEE